MRKCKSIDVKASLTLALLFCLIFSTTLTAQEERYLFFLHNRFLETHALEDQHPDYGRAEYREIIAAFEREGFVVISEKRKGDVNARDYAQKVVKQIDSLLAQGVAPGAITVVGTSKGGYIAQYVSTLAANGDLNFVFVGSFRETDLETIPHIQFCGNILTIYEKTDPYGVSAVRRKETSSLPIPHFKEVELQTGLGHGFLFRAMDEWIVPAAAWARAKYD
ncbi:alpha/beta hydrolase family protein [Cesiribacter andamanensis]|uniref:Alpha/beta hydrolase family protein n=1 Tax=Cesiribacter andamanensis AMV16 TaxID=1279009 RepID=M7N2H3_9BACT|nr:hypothetical protein [Cesiribacter andamanensis]EMR01502.1 hypothetical protein ADICEAN_03359 [Cesiribacter andamanensis AMV16]